MLTDLCSHLKTKTGYAFAVWGWSHAPAGDYGVVSGDADATLFAGSRNAEHMSRGYVDYFTRTDGETAKAAIEDALATAGVLWKHNSVQFENETGFVHHEWVIVWDA